MLNGYKYCMEASIQLLFAIAFLILGLSHLLQPLAWFSFFCKLRDQGEAGVLFITLITMPPGLLIAIYHPVWTGFPLALTLIGWGYLIKAALYSIFPKLGMRALANLREENAGMFRWAGIALILIGALLAWTLQEED